MYLMEFFASYTPVILTGIAVMLILKTKFLTYFDTPIDNGRLLRDTHPLFGKTKTWRGFILYMLCGLCAGLIWYFVCQIPSVAHHNVFLVEHANAIIYAIAYGGAMGLSYALFELPNSFIKRRLGIEESKTAKQPALKYLFFLVDQSDSILGCVLATKIFYPALDLVTFLIFVTYGAGVHIIVNLALYALKIRKRPI